MSPFSWHVVSRHLFRRTALAHKGEVESLQFRAQAPDAVEERTELQRLGVGLRDELRVSPKRWRGFWRVEVWS